MPLHVLDPDDISFPPTDLADSSGLLAIGGDLSPARLVHAYRLGIFPWFENDEPIAWWTPDPRMVLLPEDFHLSRRLARTMRSGRFSVRADTCFRQVITACSEPEVRKWPTDSWITPEMIEAYVTLHEMGYAHSVECFEDGRLVGGLYGVCLDRFFFGESMFHRVRDASKVALAALVCHCILEGIRCIDCQVETEHLASLGATLWPRKQFERCLAEYVRHTRPQKKWRLRLDGKEGKRPAGACRKEKER